MFASIACAAGLPASGLISAATGYPQCRLCSRWFNAAKLIRRAIVDGFCQSEQQEAPATIGRRNGGECGPAN